MSLICRFFDTKPNMDIALLLLLRCVLITYFDRYVNYHIQGIGTEVFQIYIE